MKLKSPEATRNRTSIKSLIPLPLRADLLMSVHSETPCSRNFWPLSTSVDALKPKETDMSNNWPKNKNLNYLWIILWKTTIFLIRNDLRSSLVCSFTKQSVLHDSSNGSTVVCKKKGSKLCKMALGEVYLSLPWWCHALFLLSLGYWRLILNLIVFS